MGVHAAASRYFDVKRYEPARRFLRLAVANGASSVEVWRLKAEVNVLLHKDGHGQGGEGETRATREERKMAISYKNTREDINQL